MTQKEFLEVVLCRMALPLAFQTYDPEKDAERLLYLGMALYKRAHFKVILAPGRTEFFWMTLACCTPRVCNIGWNDQTVLDACESAVSAAFARAELAEKLK